MKYIKKIIIADVLLFLATSAFAIDTGTEFTASTEGEIVRDADYSFGASGITITHKHTGNRDYIGTIDMKGHSATLTTNISSGIRFGLAGATITNSSDTVSAENAVLTFTPGSTGHVYISDVTIENATLKTTALIASPDNSSASATITLKDGGVFDWSYDYASWTTVGINLTVYNGAFKLNSQGSSRINLGNSSITSLSANSTISAFTYGTLEVGTDNEYKINTTGNIVVGTGSILTINSENLFTRNNGYNAVFEFAGGTSSATIVLNADNAFGNIKKNYSDSVPTATVKIDLNGNTITFETVEFTNFEKIVLEDFVDGGFLSKTNLNDYLNKFEAYAGDSTTGDMLTLAVTTTTDGYYSLVVVPEPAQWATIFGALALGFVIYRRRK